MCSGRALIFLCWAARGEDHSSGIGGSRSREILRGDVSAVYDGFCGLKEARPGDISFFGNERYAKDLASTKAGVVLVGTESVNAPEA
ncbi:MAG: LpxD N-terminal domain-containing protein, partial [Verrucomicrobiales bacterium]